MYRTYINQDGLKIILPEDIWLKIKAQVTSFYPKETGGIFTGRIDAESGSAIIEEIIIPAKISSTPVFF